MKRYAFICTLLATLGGAVVAAGLPYDAAVSMALVCVGGIVAWTAARRIDLLQRAANLEVAMLQAADATGDTDAVRAALSAAHEIGDTPRTRWTRALGWLRGDAPYLARIPWYVMVGERGSGGRTLLEQSGWAWFGKASEGQGMGPLALRLAREGAVVRPDLPAQTSAWQEFMRVLSRGRPKSPVAGVVVLLDVNMLCRATESKLRRAASEARDAVDAVYGSLRNAPPVYVVLTKFDTLPGFTETFSTLPALERQGAWGRTFVWRGQSTRERLGAAWDAFVQDAQSHLIERLQHGNDARARTAMYHFPEYLARVRHTFEIWGGTFLLTRQGHGTPRLRGLYGTSGAQPNAVREAVVVRNGRRVAQASRAFFVRGALGPMLARDLRLVEPRPKVRRYFGLGVQGLTAVMALSLALLPVWAYRLNTKLLRSAQESLTVVANERRANGHKLVPSESLDALLRQVAKLEASDAQAPWLARHTGMVQAETLVPEIRAYYHKLLRDELIKPMVVHDVQQMRNLWLHYATLGAAPQGPDWRTFFDRIKSQLLLAAPASAKRTLAASDEGWLANVFTARWKHASGSALSASQQDRMREHVTAYLRTRAPNDLTHLYDAGALQRAQQVLARLDPVDAILEPVLTDAETYSVGLLQLLGDAGVPLEGDARVRGGFTRAGWENVVRTRLPSLAAQTEGWVLGTEGEGRINKALARLGNRGIYRVYWQRYTDAWRGFLTSLRLVPPQNPGDALAMVQALTTGDPPPYRRLLQAVAHNTELQPTTGEPGPFSELLQAGVRSQDPALHEVQVLPLDLYEQQLGLLRIALEAHVNNPRADAPLHEQLRRASMTVQNLSQRMHEGTSRDVVRSLFAMPINMIGHTVLPGDSSEAG